MIIHNSIVSFLCIDIDTRKKKRAQNNIKDKLSTREVPSHMNPPRNAVGGGGGGGALHREGRRCSSEILI